MNACMMKQLLESIRLNEGEHLLVLQPFGWHIDGQHIPNAGQNTSSAKEPRKSACEWKSLRATTARTLPSSRKTKLSTGTIQ